MTGGIEGGTVKGIDSMLHSICKNKHKKLSQISLAFDFIRFT